MKAYKFEDIKMRMEESFVVSVTETTMEDFSRLSGDVNPLHVENDYAKSKGFSDKIVYGMLTASFYSTLIGMYLPGKHCLLQGIEISFNNPVFVGDSLTVLGKVSYINETYKQIEIKAQITNQNNKKISAAKIKVGFYE